MGGLGRFGGRPLTWVEVVCHGQSVGDGARGSPGRNRLGEPGRLRSVFLRAPAQRRLVALVDTRLLRLLDGDRLLLLGRCRDGLLLAGRPDVRRGRRGFMGRPFEPAPILLGPGRRVLGPGVGMAVRSTLVMGCRKPRRRVICRSSLT